MIKQNLKELLEKKLTLDIEGIDRLYLNAYQPMLQTGGGVSHFFRNHRGAVVASTCTVVIESRDTQDRRHRLEQRIDKRRHGRTLAQDDETTKEGHHQQYRKQPEFFPDTHKSPQLFEKRHRINSLKLIFHRANRLVTFNPV